MEMEMEMEMESESESESERERGGEREGEREKEREGDDQLCSEECPWSVDGPASMQSCEVARYRSQNMFSTRIQLNIPWSKKSAEPAKSLARPPQQKALWTRARGEPACAKRRWSRHERRSPEQSTCMSDETHNRATSPRAPRPPNPLVQGER
eukprot:3111866-Pleurochrysis_carterae.AAC.4